MYLSNVNASFEAPQDVIPADTSFPLLSQVYQEPCYSPGNCTVDGEDPLYYYVYYTNDTCTEARTSNMFVNGTLGECYRDSEASNPPYTKYTCLDPHTLVIDSLINGCQRPLQALIYSFSCGPGVPQSMNCNAPPTPVNPVSAAPSNLLISTLSIALLLSLISLLVQ